MGESRSGTPADAGDDDVRTWLRAVDLSEVAITAEIDGEGNLGPIGGLHEKLLAAADEAIPDWLRSLEEEAKLGGPRFVAVSAESAGYR